MAVNGDVPGAFEGENPAQPLTMQVASNNQLLKEYVAGGELTILAALRRALPHWIDDVTRDFGSDLYERMMRDGDVDSALQTLKLSVLAEGPRIAPAIELSDDEADAGEVARAKRSDEYAKFFEAVVADMNPGLRDLCNELLDGLMLGHKVAEKVCKVIDTGPHKGKLGFYGIKPRPRHNFSFVVDGFNNVLGLLTIQPQAGVYNLGTQIVLGDPNKLPNFLPREKFVVFQWSVRNGDPRGTSIGRSAYNPWFMKTQVMPEYYNYLRRFGTPSIVGKTPLNGAEAVDKIDPVSGLRTVDATGSPVQISAEEALRIAMQSFLNGTVLAVKGGTEVDLLFSGGDGQAFLHAFDYFGRQIHQSILHTARATKESQHGSKADTGVAQDLLGVIVSYVKLSLEDCLNRDMVQWLFKLNFPTEDIELCPRITLSKGDKHDKAALLTAYAAAYAAGLIHDSQLPGIDSELDLPERDMDQVMADKQHAQDLAATQAGMMADLHNPGASINDAEKATGNPTTKTDPKSAAKSVKKDEAA